MKVIPRGLYGKLVLSVSLIVIAVISVFGFITYKQQALRIETTATENLMLMAKSLSLSCADDLIVRDYARMETYLKRFAELRNVFEIQVYDESGNILSDIVPQLQYYFICKYSIIIAGYCNALYLAFVWQQAS